MRWLEVMKAKPLNGHIKVPGSKNSSLGLLAACCLCDEPVILKNIPDILDFRYICDIAKDIGLVINIHEDYILVDPTRLHSSCIPPSKSSSYRASYYFIGSLLSKFKKVSIGYPGGDNFGLRPIDQHIKGFELMGANFNFYNDYYTIEADILTGCEIYFDVITSGATINMLLAAVKAKGKTILKNAARDPEVVDIAVFLNKMGANIKGAGTDTITIDGVDYLKGCNHTAIPDRLIAGSMLMSAGSTGGIITVDDIIPEHLNSCTLKLMETGLDLTVGDTFITAKYVKKLKGVKVKTAMYPGFGTDYQQPLTAMLTGAVSDSTILEKVYTERFNHCIQLNRMGADIIIRDGFAVIPGNRELKGNWVHASDVRAGICLILAGLSADGTTCITGIEHIERGYPDIVSTFSSLGAEIVLHENDETNVNELTLNK